MRPELEERRARQREEGKVAMAEYQKNQKDTLARMAELRAQRVAREQSSDVKREKRIDEALEESFPASDPPSYVGH